MFQFALLVFGNAPICSDFSDLLRFLPICSQNKSGKPLSADPFCKSPISEASNLNSGFGGRTSPPRPSPFSSSPLPLPLSLFLLLAPLPSPLSSPSPSLPILLLSPLPSPLPSPSLPLSLFSSSPLSFSLSLLSPLPLSSSTIQTFSIALLHFILRELICVIITPLITPNHLWGVNKRNLLEILHLPVLYLLGKITPTITALFTRMPLTGQRIAMVDLVLLVFQHLRIYHRRGWSQSFPLKTFFSCSLGGGGDWRKKIAP